MLYIIARILPFAVIALYALVCLAIDYYKHSFRGNDSKMAAGDRAEEREKAMHPWFPPAESPTSSSPPALNVKPAVRTAKVLAMPIRRP